MDGLTKTKMLFSIFTAIIVFTGCKKTDDDERSYEFTKSYCAQVTVGGFIGIKEKCFAIGDEVKGRKIDKTTISIRIAEHTKGNEKPANSATYQEWLNVPISNLKMKSN